MKFPKNVIQLIREYSKPLTRPNWRNGTKHATLFKQCYIMQSININIKFELNSIELFANKQLLEQLKNKYGNIFNYSGYYYIQQFGEEILSFLYPFYYKPPITNFYSYAQNYLMPIH
jgi:hypothetical protein